MLADFLARHRRPAAARWRSTSGAADDTEPRRPRPGYTGLEGLLNYPYYQALAINQFDQVGHSLHFNLYYIFTGPCGEFSSGRDPETGEPGMPAEGGGTTTDITELDQVLAWLGHNQPGITEDDGLGPYDASVCPDGTEPPQAAATLCDPGLGKRTASSGSGRRRPRRRQPADRAAAAARRSGPARPARHPGPAGRRGLPGWPRRPARPAPEPARTTCPRASRTG